ncbi:MAG: hypothetical protein MJ223_02550 [Mycoplasmoidaceae bacterium]|nr:hypothetical protein [Mycoplasmoidaceae bacterium]
MNLIAFYGSLSTVCVSEQQKSRISSYKSFFDVITYALVPIICKSIWEADPNFHIDKFVWYSLPLMLTMIIPLFMIKEGTK